MKVRWDAYPDNIGHLNTNGCFRCHDNQHRSKDGVTIPKECSLCHIIYGQGVHENMVYATNDNSIKFRHPVDIGGAWEEMMCVECHSSPPL